GSCWSASTRSSVRRPAGLPATQPWPAESTPTATRSVRYGSPGLGIVNGVKGRGEKAPPLELYSCGGGAPVWGGRTPCVTLSLLAPAATPSSLPAASRSAVAAVYSPCSERCEDSGEASVRVSPFQWTIVPYVPKNQQSFQAKQAAEVIEPGWGFGVTLPG